MLYIILMHVFCFLFLANELLLAGYFVCISGYGNYVGQKANPSDFLTQV